RVLRGRRAPAHRRPHRRRHQGVTSAGGPARPARTAPPASLTREWTLMSSEPRRAAHGPPWARRAEKVSVVIAKEIVRDIARQRLAPGSTLEPEGAMLRRY